MVARISIRGGANFPCNNVQEFRAVVPSPLCAREAQPALRQRATCGERRHSGSISPHGHAPLALRPPRPTPPARPVCFKWVGGVSQRRRPGPRSARRRGRRPFRGGPAAGVISKRESALTPPSRRRGRRGSGRRRAHHQGLQGGCPPFPLPLPCVQARRLAGWDAASRAADVGGPVQRPSPRPAAVRAPRHRPTYGLSDQAGLEYRE